MRPTIRGGLFRLLTPLFLALVPSAIPGCATTMNLPGHWNDQRIVVDGRNSDWDITYLIDDNKLVVGLVNDSDFVYLMLATNERGLAMSMMRGLTVWFDPKGGSDKTFGLRYPVGGMFGRGGKTEQGERGEAQLEPPQELGMTASEIEILGPGKDEVHKMQLMETGGIQGKVNFTGSTFVCELRIPYRDSYPFSIKAALGSIVGLGLETSQSRMQRQGRGGEREGGQGGGMEEGGEGGYGRGGRGGFGQGSPGAPEQLDIWMKTQLSVGGGAQGSPSGLK
jgi:hypothetical protein